MGYIPIADSDFNDWVKIFAEYINTNFLALGLTLEQNTALQAFFTAWTTAYDAHLEEQATASSLVQQKDTARKNIEENVRELTNMLQASTSVTNEQKGALQITIRKTTKTPPHVPATRPMGNVDNRNRLEHKIQFFDEATPNSKAKPEGVRACEIWHKVDGPPPVDESELTYVATDTRTPYIVHYDGADAGKMAHYWLRWINTRNEQGPWSETVSVTISG